MEQASELVEELEEHDGPLPFDLVKLCGAVLDPKSYHVENHGILSVFVRYKTPYNLDGAPYLLILALVAVCPLTQHWEY